MTTTWIDIPDNPASPLAGRTTPVRFSYDQVLTSLSVAYQLPEGKVRPSEDVYRSGAFVFPFEESTLVGTTFTLRRKGGWPGHPRPYVGEAAPVVAVTTFWTTLYEPNLPAWGASHLGDVGDHVNVTIEGATWRAFGEYGNPMGVGTAQGLKLKGANRSWDIGLNYPVSPYWFLDLHTIAGFDDAKDTVILGRFTSSDGLMDIGRHCGVSSVLDDVSSNCTHMSGSHATAQIMHVNGQPTRMRRVVNNGTNETSEVNTTAITPNTHASYCIGIMRRANLSTVALFGAWTGSFPAVERLFPIAGTGPTAEGTIATLGAAFLAGNVYSISPDWTLTHCKVLQKAVV